jgi:hypothetical protein
MVCVCGSVCQCVCGGSACVSRAHAVPHPTATWPVHAIRFTVCWRGEASTWDRCGGKSGCPSGVSDCDAPWTGTCCKHGDVCNRQDANWWRCEPMGTYANSNSAVLCMQRVLACRTAVTRPCNCVAGLAVCPAPRSLRLLRPDLGKLPHAHARVLLQPGRRVC